MLSYRPPLESGNNYLATSQGGVCGYQSLMTRHSLYALFRELPQPNILLPRFVPGGVYHPVRKVGKRIFYYDVPNTLKIDTGAIERFGLDPKETIFYYIHQFGAYIRENVEIVRSLQSDGYFVVDDRSLTLPVSSYEEFGDATAYSFYKLIGIPYGGQVRTKHSVAVASASDDFSGVLRRKMTSNFHFYANPILAAVPAFPYRAYNKLFSKYVSYTCMLDNYWPRVPSGLPHHVQDKLDRIDFGKITARRIEIAKRYVSGLDPRVLLPLAQEAFTSQSMLGFPILVDDPVRLHKILVRNGIFTTLFTKIWWWDTEQPPNALYRQNLILPAHQRLSNHQVERIVECVNYHL